MTTYSKLFRISINGKYYFAKYFSKTDAKKNQKNGSSEGTHCGWVIEVPTGVWYFDDTISNMKKEVLSKYPNATITKIK